MQSSTRTRDRDGCGGGGGAGVCHVRRNDDYKSELAMWSDIVAKRPDNARAQFSLGVTLSKAEGFVKPHPVLARGAPAPRRFRSSQRYRRGALSRRTKRGGPWPSFRRCAPEAGLRRRTQQSGVALYLEGRIDEAITHYSAAIRAKLAFAAAHQNLASP